MSKKENTRPDEVFISYSWDDEHHVAAVLDVSNRLRSEGVDCVLDQYEESPSEGWPRWMDRKIRDAQFVLMVCTEDYYKKVMNETAANVGRGVKWEGGLIYQHIYNAGANNNKFIPVILKAGDERFIPTVFAVFEEPALSQAEGPGIFCCMFVGFWSPSCGVGSRDTRPPKTAEDGAASVVVVSKFSRTKGAPARLLA